MGKGSEGGMAFRKLAVLATFGAAAALKAANVPQVNVAQGSNLARSANGAARTAARPQFVPAAALVAFASSVDPAAASDVSWVAPTKAVLGPMLSLFTVLFLMRVVLSWFPKYDLNELPWNIAAWPTEPILKGTRQVIPPVAGVDISPLVWVAITSFFSEILLGPQGLLNILQKKG